MMLITRQTAWCHGTDVVLAKVSVVCAIEGDFECIMHTHTLNLWAIWDLALVTVVNVRQVWLLYVCKL
jgi:hypothetical protein